MKMTELLPLKVYSFTCAEMRSHIIFFLFCGQKEKCRNKNEILRLKIFCLFWAQQVMILGLNIIVTGYFVTEIH